MEKLLPVLRDIFIGKTFIYKSKYGGRPQGVCTDIHVSNRFLLDEKTTDILNNIKNYLDTIEYKHTPVTYHQPHIQIISENGNMYDFEDCYFLDTNITLW